VVAGGLLTTYASWRWVFFVNVPIGLLLTFGARFAIPESQRYPRRWDLPGAITGTAGFALLIYGLTRGATGPDGISHWADTGTVLALAGAAAAIIAFVAIEARSRQPLLPLRIFASRNRTGVYLILLCLASTFFGMFFFLTLFTQVVWGYSALRGGLAYLPFVGAFIVVAGICSKLVPRFGARMPMTIGALLAPAGMFWLSRVSEHSHYLTGVGLPLIVFAAAAGLIFVPLTMTLVAGIADEHSGVASSMFNAGQQIGGAVGLAVIGSVAWTVVNRHVGLTQPCRSRPQPRRARRRRAGQPDLRSRAVQRGHHRADHGRRSNRARAHRHGHRDPGTPRRPPGQPAGDVAGSRPSGNAATTSHSARWQWITRAGVGRHVLDSTTQGTAPYRPVRPASLRSGHAARH